MSLSPSTGNPPAVTHEQIEAWTKLADDVAAALDMGGQRGLDLLMGTMAEWCEAVDDVNAARQICIDLAARGLRHEAIAWHAKGFFDVADRLDPDRPGWGEWEAPLRERDIVTPRIDAELKELANRIHEDLETMDLSGGTLSAHLADLRRNMLLRGSLGERLVILESIIGLDPGGVAWQDMISPIRQKRMDAIVGEVKAAIDRRDFTALATLRREVASQEHTGELPPGLLTLADATAQWEAIADLRSGLSQAVAALVGRFDEARRQPPGSPGAMAIAEAATRDRAKAAELRASLSEAINGAKAAREVAAIVKESGVIEALRQLDAAVREPCAWLDGQREEGKIRQRVGDIEVALQRQIESAPPMGSNLETFKGQFRTWCRQAEQCLEKTRKDAARLPVGLPESTEALFRELGDTRRRLETHLKKLERGEKMVVAWFLGGLGIVVLVVIVAVVIAIARR